LKKEITMRRSPVGLVATLALAILVAPLATDAQPAGKVYRIGALRESQPPTAWVEAFQQGLRERGYVDGQNVVVEFHVTDGSLDQFPQLAEELVRSQVDILIVPNTAAALAAKQATSTIPIVMVGITDPVGSGLVASLARPGGNVTGLAVMDPDLVGKQLEFLKDVRPTVSRVAVLWNPDNPATALTCGRRTWRPRRWASSCTTWRRAVPRRLTAPSRQ
jgi:ABC-type uncharacterized transport system substrate-binding protein